VVSVASQPHCKRAVACTVKHLILQITTTLIKMLLMQFVLGTYTMLSSL
jgi:hypothetical protein